MACEELLRSVGFTDELISSPVNALSGGWRMKLSLIVAALMDADLLLLDEPTNHLDQKSARATASLQKTRKSFSHDLIY